MPKKYPPDFLRRQSRRLLDAPEDGRGPHRENQETDDSHISRRLLGRFRRPGANRVKEAPEKVMARYGKWVKRLEHEPELSQKLHELGGPALRAFGYEPPVQFLDPPDERFRQQCEEMLQDIVCPPPRKSH